MAGIALPHDRIVTQPAVGFCRNPQCREQSGVEFNFQVENDHFACPKCGANKSPMVGALVLTHLLIPDKMGPISGSGGLRYIIGCSSKRAYLATVSNLEAATDNAGVANCPGCLAEAERRKLPAVTGKNLILDKVTDAPAMKGK